MSDHDFDLFVIGGGSGGVRAARQAASAGARVALAEEYRMGGTCVIRGCVPKKLMVFASGYREMCSDAKGYGWEIEEGSFDWPSFRGRLHHELDRLEGVYRKLLDNSGVHVIDARATLKDRNTLALSTGEIVTAKTILVATGGHPVIPDLPNADLGITSNDVFLLDELPKSLLIIGGGYIACEFAYILNGLGVEVTQYYRGAQILRGFDDEARGLIAESMRERGIDLHCGTNIVEMARASEEHFDHGTGSDAAMGADPKQSDELLERATGQGPVWVKATNGREKVFDAVLFATGRRANTDHMGLEEAGVELGRMGEVKVDEYSATSVDNIYAIGDVTNRVQLTPVAIREGMAFVDTVFRDTPTPVDHDLIPSAVFTQPELGTIGLTEEAARDQEPVEVYCTSFRPMQTAFIGRPDRVLMKLIVSQETRRILGCHIVAPEAGEMIQLAGIAVKMGATKEDFDRTVAVHPTMAEEIVTMREPVRTG
ncbi:FAD-dependent oxidoreductase [Histidinibacterium aquaticum]|uniref:FAD-dependent oxidoreductase n=1 Tax=Histidinibacterium aquaticum TaxID=2613962 RepID=A0A5J5GNG0_9RHOB|nr:FAD-dependent oxidoreductase [Histidinibacterium aquaticum]KAA9009829.1 FAD-dependent oxidoreductase [Histidinibacterium aquaticum]